MLFYLQMRKLCIVRGGRRKDFLITAIVWSQSGRLMPTSEGRPLMMQILVSQCVRTLSNGRKKGERCSFVEFPHNPHRGQRRSCGAALFKAVRFKHGELILKAKRVFCYRSVKKTLQEFLKCPGFSEKCEKYK